ncbi:MAG: cytochrome P450 [Acidimicrobiia bacterium]|nr:cytochrome P450 [Acidimicrobiia bacterium]
MAAPTDLVYNPYAFDVHEDPYEVYRRLRDEAPVYWNEDLEFWALSRFEDVHNGFRDFVPYSSANGIALEARGHVQFPMMITLDPPEHTVMRKLVNRVFTPRQVAALEGETRRIVNGYLDRLIEAGEGDIVTDLTGPFPMDVISAVLGVPESDRAELRVHADSILVREDGSMEMPEEALAGFAALLGYFADDLPGRRAGHGAGLVTDLAAIEVEGRRLTDDEVLGFCLLFIIAGHETTTKMVANAVELLSRHPDQRAAIAADPALVPDGVEEVLRFHNSTQYMHRTLTVDTELHGRTMRAGDSVLLLIGAANRDEREFGADADQFDIRRTPGRHIAFGYGPHFCLGAGLARMEGRVALEEIHRRIPDYEVDHERKVRFHSGNVTGWTHLPIEIRA